MDVNPKEIRSTEALPAEQLLSEETARTWDEAFKLDDQPRSSSESPVMPNLTWPQHGFYHTADSALASLARIGLSPERITVTKAGRGWWKSRVVYQQPAEGSSLTPDVPVALTIEGDGLLYDLPTGMRVGGKEGELGIEELVSLFDDPLEKAAHHVRQGGLYFNINPENKAGCVRWILLFGINPEEWPEESWYQLALLLPRLHDLAGSERGLRLAFKLLLNLEVMAISWRKRQTLLPADKTSRFGERASCLGTDLIVGDRLEDEMMMELTLGPVSLGVYNEYQAEADARRIEQVLDLVAPFHLAYQVRWLVGDQSRAPRLGVEEENSILDVNTHLGQN